MDTKMNLLEEEVSEPTAQELLDSLDPAVAVAIEATNKLANMLVGQVRAGLPQRAGHCIMLVVTVPGGEGDLIVVGGHTEGMQDFGNSMLEHVRDLISAPDEGEGEGDDG